MLSPDATDTTALYNHYCMQDSQAQMNSYIP